MSQVVAKVVIFSPKKEEITTLRHYYWSSLRTEALYYDLFDTLLRNRQIAGDFGNIACDFGEDHNELFKSQVISIFKSQVISILARVRM